MKKIVKFALLTILLIFAASIIYEIYENSNSSYANRRIDTVLRAMFIYPKGTKSYNEQVLLNLEMEKYPGVVLMTEEKRLTYKIVVNNKLADNVLGYKILNIDLRRSSWNKSSIAWEIPFFVDLLVYTDKKNIEITALGIATFDLSNSNKPYKISNIYISTDINKIVTQQ
ncbi:hypothetical protein [Clostridium sp. Cult1]|uniref:hypothetical protein n=1 Tax=Clostridium sp. Cult1 TaxID=2079002 RepID=UPI001F3981A6|nr:hypothetical protein [Clostridium sp. Cult1]MCF6462491.1 hypothetical protein [Clostridium sp. Cult1]